MQPLPRCPGVVNKSPAGTDAGVVLRDAQLVQEAWKCSFICANVRPTRFPAAASYLTNQCWVPHRQPCQPSALSGVCVCVCVCVCACVSVCLCVCQRIISNFFISQFAVWSEGRFFSSHLRAKRGKFCTSQRGNASRCLELFPDQVQEEKKMNYEHTLKYYIHFPT